MPAKPPGEQPYQEHPELADDALIAAVRGGDADAAAELFRRYRPDAVRFAAAHAAQGVVDDIVSEAFERVFAALYAGGGPDAFRPYLFTTIRRVAVDLHRRHGRELAAGGVGEVNIEVPRPELVTEDTAGATLDAQIVRRAFQSLPERWRLVLWYTAVEARTLEETAELLDGNANSVAVLSFRAREGLRNAYLAQHVAADTTGKHAVILELLPRWVRGGLPPSKRAQVEEHLEGCTSCSAVAAELAAINSSLGAVLGPTLLGVGLTSSTLGIGAQLATRAGLTLWRLVTVTVTTAALGAGAVVLWPLAQHSPPSRPAVVRPAVVLPATTLTARPTRPAPEPVATPAAPTATSSPVPPPSPAATAPAPVPRPDPSPRPAPVDVGLGAVTSSPVGDASVRHVQVAVRGSGRALRMTVVLQGIAEYQVHRDQPYGDWSCTAVDPSEGAIRLRCERRAGAGSADFALDVRGAVPGSRITLVLRPQDVTDPAPADNTAVFVLPPS